MAHNARSAPGIPVFSLYGDPAHVTVPGFVHAERIGFRAPLHDWRIATHRHGDLAQALLVTAGGGSLTFEGEESRFSAPWLIFVPTGLVHGFDFAPGTEGHVVTMSDAFLAEVLAGDRGAESLRGAVEAPLSAAPGTREEIGIDLPRVFEAVAAEAGQGLPSAVSAVAALVKLLVVGILRTRAARFPAAPRIGGGGMHYQRFRALMEARLRDHWPVARFAEELGLSPQRLHAVCVAASAKSPQALLHERLMLEARRHLLYTTMSVSEVAFDLGFEDPAYFSRFFAKRAGTSPASYRRSRGGERDGTGR